MKYYSTLLVVILSILLGANGEVNDTTRPPHCVELSKASNDYEAKFDYEYPVAYIKPGQREAYQHLKCINPPAVTFERTLACDWAAPPLLVFTHGDQYVHVIRQDPTGMFSRAATIKAERTL